MEKFIINGPVKLAGEIDVKGAKNSALKIIPASILSKETITITNLPQIEDIKLSLALLIDLGADVLQSGSKVKINTKNIKTTEINADIANKFRASIMFVGPMLARFGEVKFPHPGGCVIGAGGRPIDIFLEGFKALNISATAKRNHYHLKTGQIKGGNFFFPKVSVTATESLLMAACLASGTTVLENCAMEPEIVTLAEYLNKQGAKITGAGTTKMTIVGVRSLKAGHFEVMPDRIETGSFAILAAATKSNIKINKCNPDHIRILLETFKKIGVNFEETKNSITIKKSGKILPYDIKTHEYPGFPTDLQSPYTVLMCLAAGRSLIYETIYDRRLLFTDSLSQMGANITMCDPHRVVINGPAKLHGFKLTSPDLRAGIALLIAALVAQGKTEIDNIYQIDRGYEKIDERLNKLGANILRADV